MVPTTMFSLLQRWPPILVAAFSLPGAERGGLVSAVKMYLRAGGLEVIDTGACVRIQELDDDDRIRFHKNMKPEFPKPVFLFSLDFRSGGGAVRRC